MDQPKRSRRRFLRLVGITLGACALTCAGSGLLLAGEDRSKRVLPVGFPDVRLGSDGASKRILVAYASAAGSTGGVAEAIGKTLAEGASLAVDVRPVKAVDDLTSYSAVVIGSAIHGGKGLPEAVEFIQANQEHLRQMPTTLFHVGMMAASRSQANRDLVAQFLAEEREMVKPAAVGSFVGALFPEQYPGFAGFGMRFFLAYCGAGMRGGDYRDPDAIRAWARSLLVLIK